MLEALRKDEHTEIPEFFDYRELPGLSNELKSKLSMARPSTLAQAGRVDGMTPSALVLLLLRLRSADRTGRAK